MASIGVSILESVYDFDNNLASNQSSNTFYELYKFAEHYFPIPNSAYELEVIPYPEYASVLLIFAGKSEAEYPKQINKMVFLGLDFWTRMAHPREPYASSLEFRDICLFPIPVSEKDNFLSMVKELLTNAKDRKGSSRSAANGNVGHQKTPGFLLSKMNDAINTIIKIKRSVTESSPESGFTGILIPNFINRISFFYRMKLFLL
jgi:hypothetical protein